MDMSDHRHPCIWLVVIISVVLAGCSAGSMEPQAQDLNGAETTEDITIIAETMAAEVRANFTPTPSPEVFLNIWYSPALPQGLIDKIVLPSQAREVSDVADASMWLDVIKPGNGTDGVLGLTTWVYVLVAAFPSTADDASVDDIVQAWHGDTVAHLPSKILLSPSTRVAFENLWGIPAESRIQIVKAEDILDAAWQERSAWALIPFEELGPRWKVLRVNGHSPLEKNLDLSAYPLVVTFGWKGEGPAWQEINDEKNEIVIETPITNRDENLMTTLLLTGTTALVRSTALKMEENGVTYPAGDIFDWLTEPDYTHVSNEVPFYTDCPPAVPLRSEARFCSDPKYIELLKHTNIDIVELTGNHLLDWGVEGMNETLDLYDENDISYYGGGRDLDSGRAPLLLEHNGNRIALIGCNAMGPEIDWATAEQPGSASCDMDWLEGKIKQLQASDYLVVVTFQHFEVCDLKPQSTQRRDFERMATAGAVIVSGSQSHCPQGMEFVGDHFVHFGLGNLWFDQMDYVTSREFLDRHIFYDGKYINTQLLTAMIEDYSKPRPMTADERGTFLKEVFEGSGW